jgi:transposase
MAKPLSLDLRERVVAAVDDGMSCRQAVDRFGVGVASAIRCCQRARESGAPKAAPQGGDRRSQRIEAKRDLILEIIERLRNMNLIELQAQLAARDHIFAVATMWRFFDQHGITWKKRPRTPQNRISRRS